MTEKNKLLATYKPNKSSFFILPVTINIIILFIIFAILFTINYYTLKLSIIFFIIILPLLITYNIYAKHIEYNKTFYEIYPHKIIEKSGGIFSDYDIELSIKNITHIILKLPYIKNKLFETGAIKIESAGSNLTSIFLSDIENSEEIYKYLQTLMQHNNFSLKKDKLIQQEKPASVGIILEIISILIGSFATLFFISLSIAPIILAFSQKIVIIILILLSLLVISVSILTYAVFRYLDLKKRRYKLYSDTITYSEGFLTKYYSFIPIENLSNSSINQNLIEKIFGIYDVMISCQGSGNEISFKNMENGDKFEENLDKLIKETEPVIESTQKKTKTPLQNKEIKTEKIETKRETKKIIDTTSTAHYKMETSRTLLPVIIYGGILFLISLIISIIFPKTIPFFIILLISYGFGGIMNLVFSYISVLFTDYYIQGKSINEKFNFLTKKNVEFNNEKITGIIIKESFIDKFFNTCSVVFWSIGANSNIEFKNIKRTKSLEELLLKKFGIKNDILNYEIKSNFSFIDFLKESLVFTLISGFIIAILITLSIIFPSFAIYFILTITIIILLYAIIGIYSSYHYEKSQMRFYKEHIYFKKGLIFRSEYYALYDNIKDIKTKKYPLTHKGTIIFNVAGDYVINTGKQSVPVSCQFNINYVNKIENKDELIDYIFEHKPNKEKINTFLSTEPKEKEIILHAKPSIANPLFVLITTSIIIFPLIIFLPISIPYLIYYIKLKSYTIESTRLIQTHGVLYKTQTSIIFSKIDFINSDSGFLNKMFNNGNITVNTAGSSQPELIISNIPNYKEFYETLKKFY
jgi:membrane protein YdbS with pleckstrin-like domain